MTYLELVQRLWMESGSSGTSPGPSDVTTQTGEFQRLVTWTNQAWLDIQRAHQDWDWMRATATFTTVAAQAVYPLGTGAGTVGVLAANHKAWARDTGRIYLTSAGQSSEQYLPFEYYEPWRDVYQFGANRTVYTMPMVMSISPAKAICLGPVAAAGYTVSCDYFSAPASMTADADVPAMPAEFHMAIVYRALMMYGAYESAQEVYDRGETEFKKMMFQLDESRLPEVTFVGALA